MHNYHNSRILAYKFILLAQYLIVDSVVRDSYEIFPYNNQTETRHMIHRYNRQEMLYLTSSIPKYLGSL